MTLEQINQRNDKFQKLAAQLAELLPGGNMLEFSSLLIRGSKKMHNHLVKLVASKNERDYFTHLDRMEEEMDEIVYLLDRLDETNRVKPIGSINDFTKVGFELLSLYSICCDQVIEKRNQRAGEEAENDK